MKTIALIQGSHATSNPLELFNYDDQIRDSISLRSIMLEYFLKIGPQEIGIFYDSMSKQSAESCRKMHDKVKLLSYLDGIIPLIPESLIGDIESKALGNLKGANEHYADLGHQEIANLISKTVEAEKNGKKIHFFETESEIKETIDLRDEEVYINIMSSGMDYSILFMGINHPLERLKKEKNIQLLKACVKTYEGALDIDILVPFGLKNSFLEKISNYQTKAHYSSKRISIETI